MIGGCQGSTGPASPHPSDGKPYGSRFPVITVRDMVRAQLRLTDMLGIVQWHSIVGGSMGGMQVLEWAVTFPDRVKTIIPIATCTHSTAQQIAWGAIGRRSIRLDPRWNNGEYYDAAIGEGPWEGLSIARMVSQVTFRSDNVFSDRFGRDLADMDAERADNRFLPPRIVLRAQAPRATGGGCVDVSFPPCPMPATMYFVVVCGPGSDTTCAVVPTAVQETTDRLGGRGEG